MSEVPNDWADAVAKAAVEAYRKGRIDGLIEAADHVENFPHANVTHRRHQKQCVEQVWRQVARLKESQPAN
jgi:hypothetical protein